MKIKEDLKRGEWCFARLNKSFHKSRFICFVDEMEAAKVHIGAEEWTIYRHELFSVEEKLKTELDEFTAKHKDLLSAIKKTPPDKLNKAQICRDLKLEYSAAIYALRKAALLGIDLTYKTAAELETAALINSAEESGHIIAA